MAFFYIYIGVNHFTDPNYFLSIMPPYLKWHLELVYISGFFEIIFGYNIIGNKSYMPGRIASFFGDELVAGAFFHGFVLFFLSVYFFLVSKGKI